MFERYDENFQKYPKSHFLMKVTLLEKNEEEESSYKTIKSEWIKSSRREFIESIQEDKANGINHEIEICYSEPEQFQLNKIYVLADREKVWVYTTGDIDG